MTIEIYSGGMIKTISSSTWPPKFGSWPTPRCEGNHTYWCLKNNWCMQSKMVFKICEGICVFHSMMRNLISVFIQVFSLYNPIKFLPSLHPKSLANLVVEVRTRHSHQILLVFISYFPEAIEYTYNFIIFLVSLIWLNFQTEHDG